MALVARIKDGNASRAVRGGSSASGGLPAETLSPVCFAKLPFDQLAGEVLGRLQHALSDLLEATSNKMRTAAEVSRFFGVDATLGWQVFRIASTTNPLAAGGHFPARVSMQKLLRAAERKGLPQSIIARVEQAHAEFEALMEVEGVDRKGMEAMISAFVPEAREKAELASKEAAFKAMTHIKGLCVDTMCVATFRHPRTDDSIETVGVHSVETVGVQGAFGIRRTRPGARIVFSAGGLSVPGVNVQTLHGDPYDPAMLPLIPDFCTSPLPEFEVRSTEGARYYEVKTEDIGLRSAVDLVMGDRAAGGGRRYRVEGARRTSGVSQNVDFPMRRLIVDSFLHVDLYPRSQPELTVFDTATRGEVQHADDATRLHDRIDFLETIRPLGRGLTNARLSHMPRYLEILEHACATAGLNPADYRGYRLDVQFPIYGAQYMVGFEVPLQPTGK